jgi:hypothetical protein
MVRYRLESPTSAVMLDKATRKITVVPKASVINVPQPLDGRQGLLEVKINGHQFLMFSEDIRQRGTPIDVTRSVGEGRGGRKQ